MEPNHDETKAASAEVPKRRGCGRILLALMAVATVAALGLLGLKAHRARQTGRAARLVQRMQDGDAEIRAAGAAEIAASPDEALVRLLVAAAAESRDHRFRAECVELLSKIGEPAVAPLIDVLCSAEKMPLSTYVIRSFAGRRDYNAEKISRQRRAAAFAAGCMGIHGREDAVQALLDALISEDSLIRDTAEDALVSLGAAAVEPAIAALQGAPRHQKLCIAMTLLRTNHPRSVETLKLMLGDNDPTIRQLAIQGLASMKPPDVVECFLQALSDSNADVQQIALSVMRHTGDARLRKPVIGLLRNGSETVRMSAVGVLDDDRSVPSTDALATALENDPSPAVRRRAIRALAPRRDRRVLAGALRMLGSGDENDRRAAAAAMGEIRDRRAINALLGALGDPSTEVRTTVLDALGNYGDARIVEGMLPLVDDPDRSVRWTALRVLGARGGDRAAAALRKFAQDKDESVAQMARRSLETLEGRDASDLAPLAAAFTEAHGDARLQALRDLCRLGEPRVVDILIEALRDEDARLRGAAAAALGGFNDHRGFGPLLQAAADPDEKVRAEALRGLGRMNDDAAVAVLMEALDDPAERIRQAAVRALSQYRSSAPLAEFVRLALHDPSPQVRLGAVSGIRRKGDPAAIPALAKILADEDANVRREAVSALGSMRDIAAALALMGALADKEGSVRQAATSALNTIYSRAGVPAFPRPELIEPFLEADVPERCRADAVRLAGQSAGPAAARIIVKAFSDESARVRMAAVEAARRFFCHEAVEAALLEAVDDPNAYVRQRALLTFATAAGYRAYRPSVDALDDVDADVRNAAESILRDLTPNPLAALHPAEGWLPQS